MPATPFCDPRIAGAAPEREAPARQAAVAEASTTKAPTAQMARTRPRDAARDHGRCLVVSADAEPGEYVQRPARGVYRRLLDSLRAELSF